MPDLRAIEEQLAALRADYAAQLPVRIAELHAGLAVLQRDWDPQRAASLYRQAHGLTGSGASFGYEAVSRAARELEHLLHAAASRDHAPEPGWHRLAASALAALTEAAGAT